MFWKRIRVKQHPRRLPGRDGDSESARPSSGDIDSGLQDAAAVKRMKEKAERDAKEAEARGLKTVTAEELLRELRKRAGKPGEKKEV